MNFTFEDLPPLPKTIKCETCGVEYLPYRLKEHFISRKHKRAVPKGVTETEQVLTLKSTRRKVF